jgi:hypothetical protein
MGGSCNHRGQAVTDSRQGGTTQLCYGLELITRCYEVDCLGQCCPTFLCTRAQFTDAYGGAGATTLLLLPPPPLNTYYSYYY